MLALAVAVLVLIDIVILFIYFVVEATSGSFTPDIKPNNEHYIAQLGVSPYNCLSECQPIKFYSLFACKANTN